MSIDWGLVGLGSAGAALGFTGQITGSNLSYKKAKKLAEYQAALNYQYNSRWAKEGPSFTRTGLESAGYNPMLAVQNGTVSGNASSFASPNTANDIDLSGGTSSGVASALSIKNMQNQTAQTESNIKLNEAQGRSAIADAISKEIHNEYLPEREQREIGKISAETTKLETDSAYNKAVIENLKDRLELDRTLGFMGIDVKKRENEINAYNAVTNRYKRSGGLKILGTGVDESRFISPKFDEIYNDRNNPVRHYSAWESKYW